MQMILVSEDQWISHLKLLLLADASFLGTQGPPVPSLSETFTPSYQHEVGWYPNSMAPETLEDSKSLMFSAWPFRKLVLDGWFSVYGVSELRALLTTEAEVRECLAIQARRSIRSSDVIETLAELMTAKEVPEQIRSDNGPEFMARAVREWRGRAGASTLYIETGSPW